ncbi:MAG: hypothetical protein IJ301_02205 [Clostridia bacterium]|nr:hypothetical protein [Clostridia bacterium]
MTKYFLNDIEITPDQARELVPILITEEKVIVRELNDKEKKEKYESLIVSEIRKKYTIDQELAILRQRDTKPEEFAEYNTYVENCKLKVKETLQLEVTNETNN